MEVADLVAKFSAEGDERVVRAIDRVNAGVERVGENSVRAGRGLGTVFQVAGGFLAAQAVSGIFNAAKGLIGVQAQAEQAHIALETVVGSTEKANALFKDVQAFAAATPFQFPELLDATIQMEAFGLNSTKWLTTVGDTAAAMNKSVDSVVQAVLDASTGEYERLKELGIKARIEGDKVSFSYMKNGQQIVQTVDKNNAEVVQSTIQAIWNDKYAGAMEKQSKTFAGQMSTLKDNISLAMQSATASVFQFATKGLAFANDIFALGFYGAIEKAFGADSAAKVEGFVGTFTTLASGIIDAFGQGTPVSEILAKLPESIRGLAAPIAYVADSFGDIWAAYRNHGASGFFHQLVTEFSEASQKITPTSAAELDKQITRALGLDRSASDIFGAEQKGRDQGRALGEKFWGALRDAFNGSSSGGGTGSSTGIVGTIQNAILPDGLPIEGSILDQWQAQINGIALGLREQFITGISQIFDIGANTVLTGAIEGFNTDLATWLNTTADDAITAFNTAATTAWAGIVVPSFQGFVAFILTTFATSGTWLLQSGVDLIGGLYNGANSVYEGSVKPLIGNMVAFILTSFLNTSTWLLQPGIDVVAGLYSGMSGVFEGSLKPLIQDIVNAIISPFSGTIGWLLQAGADAVQGLINGVTGKIPGLQAAIDIIKGIFNQIPLLGNSPWPMMISAGKDAMDGLIIGGQSRMRALDSMVQGAMGTFSVNGPLPNAPRLAHPRLAAASAQSGGTTIVIERGAFIGKGAWAEIQQIVSARDTTVIDRRAAAASLSGVRR